LKQIEDNILDTLREGKTDEELIAEIDLIEQLATSRQLTQ
jgi:hypothetical protein